MNSIREFVQFLGDRPDLQFLGYKPLTEAYALDGELLEKGFVTQDQLGQFPFYRGEYSLAWMLVYKEKLYLVHRFELVGQNVVVVLLEIKEGKKIPSETNGSSKMISLYREPQIQLADCPVKTLKWLGKKRLVTKKMINLMM